MRRPYVLIQACISLDGFLLNSANSSLLSLDSVENERVEKLRASCDAVLVGAETLRRENPRFGFELDYYYKRREQLGLSSEPVRVSLTSSGDLSSSLNFFSDDAVTKILYCSNTCFHEAILKLKDVCNVVSVDEDEVSPLFVVNHLYLLGMRRLMIEGGSKVITMFLKARLVDEMRLTILPVFVGQPDTPRLFDLNLYSTNGNGLSPMKLSQIEKVGDAAIAWLKS